MAVEKSGLQLGTYFHVGLVVADIEAAIAELEPVLGLDFNPPHESTYGGETIRVAYSRPGPPFVELVQGTPGGRWETGGSGIDHLGYFAEDLDAEVDRLVASGMPIDIDGRELGGRFTYHRSPATGMRVELVDAALRDGLMRSILG